MSEQPDIKECQIGQLLPCRRPAVAMIAVAHAFYGGLHEPNEGGAVPMCAEHAGTPVTQWTSRGL